MKPAHLGPQYGAQFQDASVVAAYRHRAPYPHSVYAFLNGMLPINAAVLDLGSGRGEIARALARRGARVDAVEPSAAMVTAGRRLSGGQHPRLRWIVEPAESAPLDPPYDLATAGNSLHWMDWGVVLPRLARSLTADGRLAIIDVDPAPPPWQPDLLPLIREYSTNRAYRPYDLIQELTSRHLFAVEGRRDLSGARYRRTIDAYVEDFHSRNGFSRERMDPEQAQAFDAAVRELVSPHADGGVLSLRVAARVAWGRPFLGQCP